MFGQIQISCWHAKPCPVCTIFFPYILWPLFSSLHFTLDSLPLRGISADWTIKEGAAISLLTPLPGTKAKHAIFMVSNKKYWLCYIRQRKENVVLPSATNTIQKIKLRKSLTKSIKFCSDWTFFFFKRRKKHPSFVLLYALKIIKKILFSIQQTQLYRNSTWGQHNKFLFC